MMRLPIVTLATHTKFPRSPVETFLAQKQKFTKKVIENC